MWTMDDALKFVNDERLAVSELAFGRKYKVEPDLTETWENGWVFYLSPVEGAGHRYFFLQNKQNCMDYDAKFPYLLKME